MPDAQGRLYAGECAEQASMKPSDWRARVSRGHAPKPVEYVRVPVGRVGAVVKAVWDPQVFADYLASRRERLAVRETREAGR